MPNLVALIVEDDVVLASAYRLGLSNAGFEVHVAHSMAELAEWHTQHTADLIVLDMNLPDGSGLDFLPYLRQTSSASARMIAITGQARFVEPYRDEFDLVLLKPVSIRQLQELATRLCQSIIESEPIPD